MCPVYQVFISGCPERLRETTVYVRTYICMCAAETKNASKPDRDCICVSNDMTTDPKQRWLLEPSCKVSNNGPLMIVYQWSRSNEYPAIVPHQTGGMPPSLTGLHTLNKGHFHATCLPKPQLPRCNCVEYKGQLTQHTHSRSSLIGTPDIQPFLYTTIDCVCTKNSRIYHMYATVHGSVHTKGYFYKQAPPVMECAHICDTCAQDIKSAGNVHTALSHTS